MRLFKFFFITIISSVLFSCFGPVRPDFTADKYQYDSGETIILTNKSVNAKSYIWTFPDGSTSTSKDATYRIPENTIGTTLSIKLEAKGIHKNSKPKSVTYSVYVYPSHGKIVFWKDVSCGCGLIDITIDNNDYNIVSNNSSVSPGCGNPSACVFELPVGPHSYYATDGSRSWNGNFTITKNGCVDIKLN